MTTVKLMEGDVLEKIKDVAEKSVGLIVSSPPYGIGKSYEHAQTIEEYSEWMKRVVKEFKRVLKDNGSICWQVGTHVSKNGEYLPLDVLFYPIFHKYGFVLKNRIIWTFGSGLHSDKRLSGRYETVMWFVNDPDKYTFNLDPIRIPSKEPGKRAYKGPNAGQLSGNPLGKNPSDVWEVMMDEWEKSMWDFPNVKSNHVEKNADHPCQFPVELAERCVLAFSNEGDSVLDPFCGTGSTGIAAIFHDRRFIGIELSHAFVDIATKRIDSAMDGTLKTRKIGTPIQEASASAKTRQIPEEWQSAIHEQKSKKRIYEQYHG